jgi:hypothetical protein
LVPCRELNESRFTRIVRNFGLFELSRCEDLFDVLVVLGTTDSAESCRLALDLVEKCADGFATLPTWLYRK